MHALKLTLTAVSLSAFLVFVIMVVSGVFLAFTGRFKPRPKHVERLQWLCAFGIVTGALASLIRL